MFFFNRQSKIKVAARPLISFIRRVARTVAHRENDFGITLVDDRAIRRLNRCFRKKDQPTDVLSFPTGTGFLEWMPNSKKLIPRLGEIVISAPTARRQAKREGHSLEKEIKLLIIHGLLHLMGYDHETDHGEMEREEYRLRAKLL